VVDEDNSVELDCEDGGNATGSRPGTGGRLLLCVTVLQSISVQCHKVFAQQSFITHIN